MTACTHWLCHRCKLTECCARIPEYRGTFVVEVNTAELDALYADVDPNDRSALAKARAKKLAEALRLYAAGSAGLSGAKRAERQGLLYRYVQRPTKIPTEVLDLLAEFTALGARVVEKCGTDPTQRGRAIEVVEDVLRRLK